MHSNSGIPAYLDKYVDPIGTIQSRFIAALEKRGAKRLPDALKGCVKMTHPDALGTWYYVSENGALRIGSARTKSEPVSDSERYDLLVEADAMKTPAVTVDSVINKDAPDIEDVINQVESILRLRAGVRISRENIARETAALMTNVENLTQSEHDLAVLIGGDVARSYAKSAWHESVMTKSGGWTAPADKAKEVPSGLDWLVEPVRQKFDRRLKKGDLVWLTRRRALGTVTGVDRYGKHTITTDGETYITYSEQNLRVPLPDDIEYWRVRPGNADA